MIPDPHTPRDFALLCVAQWGRSEEFPGHPFPGLVDHIELTIKTALERYADHLVDTTPVCFGKPTCEVCGRG